MLAKRIIPCLDVRDGVVVKGVQFRDHRVVGDIITLAQYYRDEGADELVFYDITASSEGREISQAWVRAVARVLDIPFCVAGGIRSLPSARAILAAGADKISINTPALQHPELITELADHFGSQSVVVGIDSFFDGTRYCVYSHTGDPDKMQETKRETLAWAQEAEAMGAGEIVLNCMNQDGVRQGYDVDQLSRVKQHISIPLIASGGAGTMDHFKEVFAKADVDGALAASVFHDQLINIPDLKAHLRAQGVEVRV